MELKSRVFISLSQKTHVSEKTLYDSKLVSSLDMQSEY